MNLAYFREKLRRLELKDPIEKKTYKYKKERQKTKEMIVVLIRNQRRSARRRKAAQPLLRKKLEFSEDD